ncbi:MAG TPA: PAS domain-containing protein, partial [Anaerolineales bacterium]|nr:PAS domain-containing protein [Anaerolineales bacterium]
MRTFLNQLQVRLILGSLLFLLGLTGAIILVVRDSLLFSARNMTEAGTQALVEQRQFSLLEIARREAELSDHAIHHNPSDLAPLRARLNSLQLTPNGFAFVMDAQGQLAAASSDEVETLLGETGNLEISTSQQTSLLELDNTALHDILLKMQAGEAGTSQIELGGDSILITFAPMEETGWSFAIVEPVADIAASAEPLSEEVRSEVGGILQATLITIAYFAVVAIIGAVIAARALTGPIQTLVAGTRSITAGDLSVRIPVKSSDELGMLAASFNQMVEELQARNTDLLKANEMLSERESRLRLITEVTTDALYEWDVVAGKTQWSHSYRTLFGYPAEGSHEHHWWRERVHPDDLEQAVARLELALQRKDEFISFEYRYRRADGTYAHVVDRGYFFYGEAGQPLRMVGAMIDISDRVTLSEAQAQAALEERQRLARELHDSVTQSLYSLTLLAEASRRTAQTGEVEKVVANIARLGETAQQALKEMRLLVYELRPLALEQAGLAEALQSRLDAVEKRAGVDAQLRLDLDADLPAEV